MRYLKTLFVFTFCFALSSFAQKRIATFTYTSKDKVFSKISADSNGAWLISGDSSKIYRFASDTVVECKSFTKLSSLKYTSIISKGDASVLVGTNTDSLFFLSNGQITKLSVTNGITPSTTVSMVGDINYTFLICNNQVYTFDGSNFQLIQNVSYPTTKLVCALGSSNYSSVAFGFTDTNISIYNNYDNLPSAVIQPITEDEIPMQLIPKYPSDYFMSNYTILRTNKRVVDLNNKNTIYDKPCFSIGHEQDKLLIGTNNGAIEYNIELNEIQDTLFKGEIIRDMSESNSILWLLSDNKIFQFFQYDKPDLQNKGEYELCKNSSFYLNTFNIKTGDEISWYRNDTLINPVASTNLEITTIGDYKAIITNAKWNTSDTTHVLHVIWRTSLYWEHFTAPEVACEGAYCLSVDCYDFSKIIMYKDGVALPDYVGEGSFLLPVYESGTYWYVAENCNGYKIESPKRTINVIKKPTFATNLVNGSTVCAGSILHVNTNADYYISPVVDSNSKDILLSQNLFTDPAHLVFSLGWNGNGDCRFIERFEYKIETLPYAEIKREGSTLTAVPSITNSEGTIIKSFNIQNYQWYYNENEIVGANLPTLTYNKSGEYKVKLVSDKGCVNYSKATIFPTDIAYLSSTDLVISPNPSAGPVYLTGDMVNKITKIEVYNNLAKLEFVKGNDFSNIDLSALTKGLYFLKVYANNSVFTYKVSIIR